jgi:hypothetical protein
MCCHAALQPSTGTNGMAGKACAHELIAPAACSALCLYVLPLIAILAGVDGKCTRCFHLLPGSPCFVACCPWWLLLQLGRFDKHTGCEH